MKQLEKQYSVSARSIALDLLVFFTCLMPRRSQAALARLVLAPELAGITGSYFAGKAMISSSAESYERAAAAELWETSADLVRIKHDLSRI